MDKNQLAREIKRLEFRIPQLLVKYLVITLDD